MSFSYFFAVGMLRIGQLIYTFFRYPHSDIENGKDEVDASTSAILAHVLKKPFDYIKLKRDGKIANVAVYNVLGIDLDGHREILGHWIGDGVEGSNFWLSVITDLQNRGVQDVFLAAIDGLSGFKEAIHSVFPKTRVQRCIIHQVRYSLKYVVWKDRKAFMADLKKIYQAATREEAEANLLKLEEVWGGKYGAAVRSWQNNWDDLATFFEFPQEIRRLIYTTNTVEGYHRQLRKVIKNKGSFPTDQSARK